MARSNNLAKYGLLAGDLDTTEFRGEKKLIYAVILTAIEDAILGHAAAEYAERWLRSKCIEETSLLWWLDTLGMPDPEGAQASILREYSGWFDSEISLKRDEEIARIVEVIKIPSGTKIGRRKRRKWRNVVVDPSGSSLS